MRVASGLFAYHQRYHSWAHNISKPSRPYEKRSPRREKQPGESTASTSNQATAVQRGDRNANYNWMVGESCWPSFARRVKEQYNFSMTSSMQARATCDKWHGAVAILKCGLSQDWLDNFMRKNISLDPSLRLHSFRDISLAKASEVIEPVCAAIQDAICVTQCRPAQARLRPDHRTFHFIPSFDQRGIQDG